MYLRSILSALLLSVSLHGKGQGAPCITNCHDLAEIFRLQTKIVAPVELTARVTVPPGALMESVVLEDASGGVILQARDLPSGTPIRQDDKVRLVGNIRFADKHIVNFTSLTVLSQEAAQPPPDVTPEEILAGRADCRYGNISISRSRRSTPPSVTSGTASGTCATARSRRRISRAPSG